MRMAPGLTTGIARAQWLIAAMAHFKEQLAPRARPRFPSRPPETMGTGATTSPAPGRVLKYTQA